MLDGVEMLAEVVTELLQYLSENTFSLSTSLGDLFLASVRLFSTCINVFGQVTVTGELKRSLVDKVRDSVCYWVSKLSFAEESLDSTLMVGNFGLIYAVLIPTSVV